MANMSQHVEKYDQKTFASISLAIGEYSLGMTSSTTLALNMVLRSCNKYTNLVWHNKFGKREFSFLNTDQTCFAISHQM